jgi:probable FeS assembly SUF system protein SufT
MPYESFSLERDIEVTIIPAGDVVKLSAGTSVEVTQSLGNSITVRALTGLYRLEGKDIDALGPDAAHLLAAPEPVLTQREGPFSEEHIWDALKSCFDPEIPVNIVDLGLIYDLKLIPVDEPAKFRIEVKMTLTAQGCGMGPVIAEDAKTKIEALPEVTSAEVEIVWDPPWTPHMISEEGRRKLGLD